MPTVTELVVEGFANCIDGRCPGYLQERVGVVRRTQEFSFVELGGDLPGVERSMIDVAGFADERDVPCPHCGQARIASLEQRPEYPQTSGQDPLRLLNLTHDKQVRDMQISGLERDREMAEMRAAMAELRAELASRPRGPGRPRKVEDE